MDTVNKINIIDKRDNFAKNILLIYKEEQVRNILKFVLESYYNINVLCYQNFDQAIEEYVEFNNVDIIISENLSEDQEFDFLQFINFVNDLAENKNIDFFIPSQIKYKKDKINFFNIESKNISEIYKEIRNKSSKKFSNNKETFIEFDKSLLQLFTGLNKNIYFCKEGKYTKYLSNQKIDLTSALYLNYNDIMYIIKNQQLDDECNFVKGTKFCKETEVINKLHGCTEEIKDNQVYFLKKLEKQTENQIRKITIKNIHFKTVEEYILSREIKEHDEKKILAMVCCIMSKQIDWSTEATFDKLIAAAYLHDVGLPENLKDIYFTQEIDLSHLTARERSTWDNYPKNSLELVSKMKSLPTLIDDLILYQNHYTNKINFDFQKINQLTAIFIIGKHFTNYYFRNGIFSVDDYFNKNIHLFNKYNLASVARKLNKKAKWKS